MPSTVTHQYFATDVHEKLSEKIQKKINLNILAVTTLGPDPFYFNAIYSLGFNKNASKLSQQMHRFNTKKYIITMAKYIKDHNLSSNQEVMSYFYGTILHMILDSTIHPFVFYKTGNFNLKKKKSYKYNGYHKDLETFFDCYLIYNREAILPHHKKIYTNLNLQFKTIEFNQFINYVLKSTYQFDNGFKVYQKSIKAYYLNNLIIRYDPWKIKRKLTHLSDFIFGNFYTKMFGYLYSNNFKDKYHYLNLEKKEWNHPVNKYEYYNTSLLELYILAMHKAIKLITEIDIYFDSKKDLRYLNAKIPNISYITGKDINDNQVMKYFEY